MVGEAENGREGVDLALELRPDVVVMDLVMPELDGVQATLELLKEWPEAKISKFLNQLFGTMKKFNPVH